MNKKRLIIIVSLVIALILIAISIYLVFFKKTVAYPDDPISQSVSTINQNIEANVNFENSDRKLYSLSSTTRLDNIEDMISDLKLDLSPEIIQEGEYYSWSGEDGYFVYNLKFNTLTFQVYDGIETNQVTLNANYFNDFTKKYFDVNWEYEVFETELSNSGSTIFYAKRHLDDTDFLEGKNHNKYTDYLAFQSGKVFSGEILLTEFKNINISVPLIDSSRLKTLINLDGYPKEIYADYSVLQNLILDDVSYLSDDFVSITETLDNCEASSSEVIYLYKTFDQTYLTPVYKLELQCTVEYDNQEYTVPAVGYVNAIDPEYVTVSD